jgi:hypothetical protein
MVQKNKFYCFVSPPIVDWLGENPDLEYMGCLSGVVVGEALNKFPIHLQGSSG